MDQDMSLNVQITADAASATTQIDSLNARLGALETAFNRGSTGAQNIARDVENMGSSTEKAATSVSKLGNVGKFIEDVGSHYRIAANAANIFGIKSEAAAAKLDGLVRIFDGMKTAVPALLGIGAAITAAFAGFEEIKNAASAAATWQQNLSILGQTVRDQGGNWKALSQSVQDWADVQEKSTQFSRDDAVQALTTLTATGMKLNDAMVVTRVSEDAAAATGRSLRDINFALSEAMHGRTQALTQLGLGTKQSIHDGMSFTEVLKEIEAHMGGAAAAAADTYAGKVAQLHNSLETLQEKIGSAVLPALTALTKAMINLIGNAENTFSRWGKAIQEWANQHKEQIAAVEGFLQGGLDVFRAVFDAIAGLVKGAVQAFGGLVEFLGNAFTGDWRGAWDGVKNIFEGVLHGMLGMFGTWGDNIITMAERTAQAVGGIFSHIFAGMGAMMHGDIQGATKDLNSMFSGFGNIGGGLNWSFHDTISGIQDAFSSPSGSTASNPADIGDISSGLGNTEVGGKLGGIAKHLKHIAHAAKKAKESIDSFEVSLYNIQDPLKGKSQKDLLDQVLSNDPTSTYGDTTGKSKNLQKTLQEAQKQWAEYYKSLEENAKQWTDTTAKWIDEMFSHGKKGVNMFVQTFKTMLKEIEQALLKSALFEFFMGAQGAKGPSFMSLFAQNMGFGTKSPSGGVGGGQVSTNSTGGIIGSLVGTSTATQLASSLPTDSLMSLMFGVGAPSLTGGGSGGGMSGAVQVLAGAGGPGGGTLAGGSNAGGILSSGSNAISSLGSLGGLKSGIGGIGALLGTHLGTFGGGGYGSFFSSSGSLGTLGSGMLGAAGGYLVGTGIGDTVFGNQPLNKGAQIGGALGGGAGAIFGPALMAALGMSTGGLGILLAPLLGAVGGSLLGGLLGNHDNPANMPDKYNTQNFGQAIANLTGAGGSGYHITDPTAPGGQSWFGANGSKFFSQIGSITGANTSGIGWAEQMLAQYAKPGTTQMGSNTPSWLAPIWNQMVGAFGVSSSGTGQLNFGHNIGQEYVSGAMGASNQPTSYTNLINDLDTLLQNYTTQGAVGISNGNEPGTGGLPPMSPGANGGFGVYSPFAGAYVVNSPGGAPQLVGGGPSFALNPDPNAASTQTVATNPPGTVPGQLSSMLPGLIGNGSNTLAPNNVRNGITVNVNVAGNVTAENNLAETIKQKLLDITTRNLNSGRMTLGGVGF